MEHDISLFMQSSHLSYKSCKSHIFEKDPILSYILAKCPISPVIPVLVHRAGNNDITVKRPY